MKPDLNKLIMLAKQNDAEAQYLLATEYMHAEYLPFNPNCALFWYLESARLGYTSAKFEAGLMLLNGEAGVPINTHLGKKLLISAADDGNHFLARSFLAHCYVNGKYGFEVNHLQSAHYANTAVGENSILFSESMDFDVDQIGIQCSDEQ